MLSRTMARGRIILVISATTKPQCLCGVGGYGSGTVFSWSGFGTHFVVDKGACFVV